MPQGIDDFINEALERGARDGLQSLDPASAIAFLISEAEVYCNKDGIDSFIHRYGAAGLSAAARAFSAVGAVAIADGLHRLALATPPLPEPLLESVNNLICECSGYDYEAMAKAADQLRRGWTHRR